MRNPEDGTWWALGAVALIAGAGTVSRRGSASSVEISRVRSALTPELLKSSHKGQGRGPTAGHCYVASQALWHALGGKKSGYTPHVGPAPGGGTHWWLVDDKTDKVLDPTSDQFPSYDYSKGVGKGFLTREPSKRAQVVLDRMGSPNVATSEGYSAIKGFCAVAAQSKKRLPNG
jgi:hypothetical protein